jgi:hypothetical protein
MDNQPDVIDHTLMDILNLAKEDCESSADNMIVPSFFGKKEMEKKSKILLDVHCNTPVKTLVGCEH